MSGRVVAPAPWWRWLLGVGVLCTAVPLLLTLLLNVAVAGSNLGDGYGMSTRNILVIAAAATVPLNLLFAAIYRRWRSTRDRQFLVRTGALLWGVGGGAGSSIFGAEAGAMIVTFPLMALAGAAASYLFILMIDGRAGAA